MAAMADLLQYCDSPFQYSRRPAREVAVGRVRLGGAWPIRIQSIRDHVYAPLHRYLIEHPETLDRLHPVARIPARVALCFSADSVYRGLDYVLATAVKP